MKTLLIDANSLIHRCFHALPPFTGPNGEPTGALYGLSNIILKIMREQNSEFIAGFFDRPEPTRRKQIFEQYKIHRPKAPDELISQIIEAHNLFEAFGIKTYELAGYEADDLIAAAALNLIKNRDVKIIILTGDSDLLQLVEDDKIVVETIKKGISETIIYNEHGVEERYGGLKPKQLPDYKGLVGDASDNILGVPSIGPKTAIPIIKEYGSLENFLENGQLNKNYPKILKFKDQALLSKKLGALEFDAPFNIKDISELKYKDLPKENLISYFTKLGFKSLVNRLVANG